jgi:hypothetical protein
MMTAGNKIVLRTTRSIPIEYTSSSYTCATDRSEYSPFIVDVGCQLTAVIVILMHNAVQHSTNFAVHEHIEYNQHYIVQVAALVLR